MKKNINLQGLNASYLEKNPERDNCILFIHGNSCSSDYFSHQFSSRALDEYRLISLDLFGHGDSDKLPESNYSIPAFASQINDFIVSMGLKKILIAGHSLGGHIAFELIGAYPHERYMGMAVWGTPPLTRPPSGDSFLPHPHAHLFFKKDLLEQEILSLLKASFSRNSSISPELIGIFQKADPYVRESVYGSLLRLEYLNEVDILNKAPFEPLVLLCAQDEFISPSYLKEFKPLTIEGGHFAHVDCPESFNSVLNEYAAKVYSRAGK